MSKNGIALRGKIFAPGTQPSFAIRSCAHPLVQPKLEIGAVDSPLEREAECLADHFDADARSSVLQSNTAQMRDVRAGRPEHKQDRPQGAGRWALGPWPPRFEPLRSPWVSQNGWTKREIVENTMDEFDQRHRDNEKNAVPDNKLEWLADDFLHRLATTR